LEGKPLLLVATEKERNSLDTIGGGIIINQGGAWKGLRRGEEQKNVFL